MRLMCEHITLLITPNQGWNDEVQECDREFNCHETLTCRIQNELMKEKQK